MPSCWGSCRARGQPARMPMVRRIALPMANRREDILIRKPWHGRRRDKLVIVATAPSRRWPAPCFTCDSRCEVSVSPGEEHHSATAADRPIVAFERLADHFLHTHEVMSPRLQPAQPAADTAHAGGQAGRLRPGGFVAHAFVWRNATRRALLHLREQCRTAVRDHRRQCGALGGNHIGHHSRRHSMCCILACGFQGSRE